MTGLEFPLLIPIDIPGTRFIRPSVVVDRKGRSAISRVSSVPPTVGESVCTTWGWAETSTVCTTPPTCNTTSCRAVCDERSRTPVAW